MYGISQTFLFSAIHFTGSLIQFILCPGQEILNSWRYTFSMIPDPRLLIASTLSFGNDGVNSMMSACRRANGIVTRTWKKI